VIVSFKDQATEDIYNGVSSKKALRIPREIWSIAQRKLDMLNSAHHLMDLVAPPGNWLEGLKGDLKGFHSIRVNNQYRILFRWSEGNASYVHIVDYH